MTELEPIRRVCNRCGLCCYPNGKKCRYLVVMRSGLTLCRIYRNRLGKDLGGGFYCHDILDIPDIFPGCPFNDHPDKAK